MKQERLCDAIGGVDDRLVMETAKARRRLPKWTGWVAAAAAVCITATALLMPGRSPIMEDPVMENMILAKASYPTQIPYPGEFDEQGNYNDAAMEQWWDQRGTQREMGKGHAEGLEAFYQSTMEQYLAGGEGENRVYSPLNIYFALAMLAETTAGESRQQILDLLGVADVEALRARVKGLWNANYQDDGYATSLLANSLWLQEGMQYKQDTLDILAREYYASSYQGEMGSPAYNAALQAWLNDNTGGLLKDQAAGVEMDRNTLLALASTVYFTGRWDQEFSPEQTRKDVFYTVDGEVTVDFMHAEIPLCPVYYGDGYKAIYRQLSDSYSMWLLLPDEGVSLNTMITEGDIPGHLTKWTDYQAEDHDSYWDYYDVTLSMPKFDVSGDIDLIPGLQNLGITRVFDSAVADFSPVFTQKAFVSNAKHAARVQVDEEGCQAAAFTVVLTDGMGAPDTNGHLDFNLNRPFVFALTGAYGSLLFAGAVETP